MRCMHLSESEAAYARSGIQVRVQRHRSAADARARRATHTGGADARARNVYVLIHSFPLVTPFRFAFIEFAGVCGLARLLIGSGSGPLSLPFVGVRINATTSLRRCISARLFLRVFTRCWGGAKALIHGGFSWSFRAQPKSSHGCTYPPLIVDRYGMLFAGLHSLLFGGRCGLGAITAN